MIKIADQDVKDLLNQLDGFLAKAYGAYIHEAGFNSINNPRITMDEVIKLQERIRLITEN